MENVVNAPQNPVIIKSLYSGGISNVNEEYMIKPIIKLPIRLTVNVPMGNPNLTGTTPLIMYRNIAPTNPPTPIIKSSLKFSRLLRQESNGFSRWRNAVF